MLWDRLAWRLGAHLGRSSCNVCCQQRLAASRHFLARPAALQNIWETWVCGWLAVRLAGWPSRIDRLSVWFLTDIVNLFSNSLWVTQLHTHLHMSFIQSSMHALFLLLCVCLFLFYYFYFCSSVCFSFFLLLLLLLLFILPPSSSSLQNSLFRSLFASSIVSILPWLVRLSTRSFVSASIHLIRRPASMFCGRDCSCL